MSQVCCTNPSCESCHGTGIVIELQGKNHPPSKGAGMNATEARRIAIGKTQRDFSADVEQRLERVSRLIDEAANEGRFQIRVPWGGSLIEGKVEVLLNERGFTTKVCTRHSRRVTMYELEVSW